MSGSTSTETARSKRGVRTAMAGGGVLSLGAALFGPLSPADAATFEVTNANESGAGSLRQAILDANAAVGADTVEIAPGLGTIVLSSVIQIDDDVTIAGTATVSGNDANRIFYITYAGAVTISGLTLTAGATSDDGGAIYSTGTDLTLEGVTITSSSADGAGGGLHTHGDVDIEIIDSVITGNTAGEGGGGGSIVGEGQSDDDDPLLLVRGSTVSGNTAAGNGGGLDIVHVYDITIDTSTFSGNTAGSQGGGIYQHGHSGVTMTVTSSTFSGNSAGSLGGGIKIDGLDDLLIAHTTITGNDVTDGVGGGIDIENDEYAAVFEHVIIAGNTAIEFPDVSGEADNAILVSFSLIQGPFSPIVSDEGGNVFGQAALLGPLQDNGGPTQTHLPAAGSPAIDAGDSAFAAPPSTDQRGLPRVSGAGIDMGAVEVQPAQVPTTTTTTTTVPAGQPPAQPVPAAPTFTG